MFMALWADAVAFTPLGPVTDGHVLIVPRRHVADFTVDPDVTATVARCASQLGAKIGGSMNLITSCGKPATQSVFHLHAHLVPRQPGDGLCLPWSCQTRSGASGSAISSTEAQSHGPTD